MLRIENLIDTLIDLLNFIRSKDGRVLQIFAEVLAENSVAFVEVDIAIPISFVVEPPYCAYQLTLNRICLTGGRNQLLP